MKLKLIYPSPRKSNPALRGWKQPKSHRYPGLGLLTVASLCPPSTEIQILDDDFDDTDYYEHADLIGISALTLNAHRAYEIADHFRERKIPVVLGGMHMSACPEEALAHADSIVVGEAEDTWPTLLKDFHVGQLKKIYQSTNSSDLANTPFPKRELLNKSHYTTINTIQASRGCPFHCDFCSMSSLFGPRTRFRPVEAVIEEIKTLEGQLFILNDDNIAQAFDYYKELFRRLIPLKKSWAGEASWNIIQDQEFMDLLQKSGCRAIHVGFDSLQNQRGVYKIPSEKDIISMYREVVSTLQARNICAFGAFVLGFDNEDETIFEKTLRFSLESKMEVVQFNILTPYPGTRLYRRLKEENRITDTDWSHYISSKLCFRPKNMSERTFVNKFRWMKQKYFSYFRIGSRLLRAAKHMNLVELAILLGIHLGYKKGIQNTV